MRFLTIVIILVCFFALAATVATIIIGSGSFEGLVVDKPYETGLAWDEQLRKCERLGWSVSLREASFTTGTNDITITAAGKNGTPLADASVNLIVSRPATRAYDRSYSATRLSNGLFRASIVLPLFGAWNIKTGVIINKDRCEFERTIYAQSPGR